MLGMPGRLWWLCACLALGACRADSLFVPSAADGLLAVLVLDAEGAVLSVNTCFGPCGMETNRIEVPELGTEVVVLRLSQAAMIEAAGDFDLERAQETTLLARSSCAPGRSVDGRSREIPLPAGAEIERAHVSSGASLMRSSAAELAALARVVLSVPIKSQRCPLPGVGKIRPFGGRFRMLGTHARIGGADWVDEETNKNRGLATWRNVVAVDSDHLLVQSARAIALLDRGADYEGLEVPSALLPSLVPTATLSVMLRDQMNDLVVEHDPSGLPRKIYAVGRLGGGGGFVLGVEISGGLPRFSVTATVVPAGLEAGIVQGDGSLLAVGGRDNGTGMPSVGYALELGPHGRRSIDFPGELLNCVALSGIEGRPHLAGTDGGAVYFGDLWNMAARKDVSPINRSDLKGIAMVARPTGPEIWVTTLRLGFFRRPLTEAEFSRVEFEVPPELNPCAGTPDSCGRPTELAGRVEYFSVASVGAGAGRIFSHIDGCTGAISFRLSDGCLSGIPDLDSPVVLTGKTGWRATGLLPDRVFYVGTDGVVGELVLE